MGIGIQKADIKDLLNDKAIRDELVKKSLEDPETIKDIASDVADKMSDLLEDDPEFKKQIMEAAVTHPEFRKIVIKELLNDMS